MPSPDINIFLLGPFKQLNWAEIRQKTYPLNFHQGSISAREIANLSATDPTLLLICQPKNDDRVLYSAVSTFLEKRRSSTATLCLVISEETGLLQNFSPLEKAYPLLFNLKMLRTTDESFIIRNIIAFSEQVTLEGKNNLQGVAQFEQSLMAEIASKAQFSEQQKPLLPDLQNLLNSQKTFSDQTLLFLSLGQSLAKFAAVEHFSLYQTTAEGVLTAVESTLIGLKGKKIKGEDDCPAIFCLVNRSKIVVNRFEKEIRVGINRYWPPKKIKTCLAVPIMRNDTVLAVLEFCNVMNTMDQVFTQFLAETIEKQVQLFILWQAFRRHRMQR